MYGTTDFKKGLKVLFEDNPYEVIDFEHVKPGKGNQFTRVKLKNLKTKINLDRTFRSGEKFGIPDIDSRSMNFLYKDSRFLHFMDNTTFEQTAINEEDILKDSKFLTDNLEIKVLFFNEEAIGLELPKSVHLKVDSTEPGLKGNTVSGATKQASLETGLVIQVPLHINKNDVVKVDTTKSTYVERVNQN